ncbi:MAG TPA: hypothetical protein VF600_04505 [Abditibacteriaceae bacterium]|jgi:hypothetical protein
MWSDEYCPLSRLEMRGQQTASVAWRDGKLYFCLRAKGDTTRCDNTAIEVADHPETPPEDTQILESACAERLYILSGERTWCSYTKGREWEEM